MKQLKTIIITTMSILGVFLTACGSDSSSGVDTAETPEVKTIHGLGECKSANEGVTKFVTSEDQYYTCSAGEWKVSAAPVDSTKSINTLGECEGANEGVTKFVTSEKRYYTCSGGEWKISAASVDSTKSINGLGECKGANEGVTKFVTSEEQYYKCDGGNWKKTDDPLQSSSSSRDADGTVTETISGTIVLDKENRTFTAVSRDQEELCVKEGFDYSWKTVDWGDDSIKFKYEFVGDTLVLYRSGYYYDDEEEYGYGSSYGQMYVGGMGGSLNGTWKSTLCSYSSKEGSSCSKACEDVGGKLTDEEFAKYYEDMYSEYGDGVDIPVDQNFMDRMSCVDEGDYAEVTLKISGTSFTATEKYHYEEDHDFDDYTNSRFMARFYESLIRKDPEVPSLSSLFREDSDGVKAFIGEYKKYKVAISNQTKKSITFSFMETENITITVDDVVTSGYSNELAMTLKTSDGSCKLMEESGEVTKSTCSAVYGEYFDMVTEENAFGNKISYAEYFSKDNEMEFESCAKSLMDALFAKFSDIGGSSGNDACDPYKEAYEDCITLVGDVDYCESYREYYESCLNGSESSTLSKKASSAVAAAKAKNEKIIKTSRRIARSLRRIGQ